MARYFLVALWLLGSLPALAQRLTIPQQTELESQGYRLYRVSGQITVTSTLSFEKAVDRSSSGLTNIIRHKGSQQSRKTAQFSGETYATPLTAAGGCSQELQTNNDPVGWATLSVSGSYEAQDSHTEDARLAAPTGSCVTHSYSRVQREGAIDDAGVYINLCYNSAQVWLLEVALPYKNVTVRTERETQSCEAGRVETKRDVYTLDNNADVSVVAGNDRPGSTITFDEKGFFITRTETRTEPEKVLDLPNDEGMAIRTTTIQLTLIGTPIPTTVAYLEPIAGMVDFGQWLPKGPDPQLDHSTGNAITVEVYLKNRKYPGQKRKVGIREVRYRLDGVSHEPGWAMNYPNKDPLTTADLGLYRATDVPNPQIEQLALTVTKAQNPDLRAVVQCFDYRAFS